MKTTSLHSPKNKFRGEITFPEPRDGYSVISYTANDIDYLKSLFERYAPGHIRIFENKSVYPSFDWQLIDSYDIEK